MRAGCSGVIKASETTTLEEAQTIMAKHQLQLLPFVDQEGKLVCHLTASTCSVPPKHIYGAVLQQRVSCDQGTLA